MENAPLIGLSRQIALQRQMDVLANNMANLNTYGFKAESVLFEDYLMPTAKDDGFTNGDKGMHYTQDWATVHNFKAGSYVQTGNELDVAIQGKGFFSIQTPEGVRYTRDGAFKIDNTGTLVTSDGYPVMAETGLIRFDASEKDIAFSPEGSVITSAGNKGRLQIVEIENLQALKRTGGNMFSLENEQLAAPATESKLAQGMIEGSNVSGITEMASMIRVTRAYQMVSQFIQQHDQLRQSAIRTLGQIA